MSRKLFNSDFEIEGNGVSRQLAIWLRMKTSILGNFDTGPGLKNLLTLLFIKYLGRALFWLRFKLENQHALKARIRSLLPASRGKS